MAAADDDFAFALAAVRRLLADIREEVADRRREGGRGEILADHALQVLNAVDQRVDEEEGRYAQRQRESSKKAAARQLRFYAQLVWGTHCTLQWLRPDESKALGLGDLYLADELALSLLGPGVEVTPVASSEYMYSTSTWPFDWLLEDKLGQRGSAGHRPIPIVLAFPASEQHTSLLHCLFAHELSHAAVLDKKLVQQVLAPLRESDKLGAWLDDAVATAGDLTPFARERGKALVDLWLEELLCDAHAFALLGPAYLFAFAEIGLSVGWAEPDDEHPSMALRTKLLVDFAERDGWSSFLEERVPRIWAWLEYAADGPSIVRSPLESFAERVCRNSVDRVIGLTEESIGAAWFSPAEWRQKEQRLADLLENDILPVEGENGDPATHAQILLAAWLQVLSTHGNTPEAISKAVAESDYQRFVDKALEMSTALRVWKDLTPT